MNFAKVFNKNTAICSTTNVSDLSESFQSMYMKDITSKLSSGEHLIKCIFKQERNCMYISNFGHIYYSDISKNRNWTIAVVSTKILPWNKGNITSTYIQAGIEHYKFKSLHYSKLRVELDELINFLEIINGPSG